MEKSTSTSNKSRRHPDWIVSKLPTGEMSARVRTALSSGGLHTVCQEARCPNRGECWDAGAATFLILGNNCTRNCLYCSVRHGETQQIDSGEPRRIAEAAAAIGCRFAVITSVTRDDIPDGGASHFARVANELRNRIPGVKIEFLIPDFSFNMQSLNTAIDAEPDVLSHNIEVVSRLFPSLRPQGDYEKSLELLAAASSKRGSAPTKSGIMAGLGETRGEISEALRDLKRAGCRIVTVGQYLQPSKESAPVARYLHPDEFIDIKAEALSIGFAAASCGPLVRSSYLAEELAAKV